MRAQLASAQEAREQGCVDDAIGVLLEALPRASDCGGREEGATLANLALLAGLAGTASHQLAYAGSELVEMETTVQNLSALSATANADLIVAKAELPGKGNHYRQRF